MEKYKLLPGTKGIIEIIKKVVAGTFIILAMDSAKMEATSVARNTRTVTPPSIPVISYIK